MINRAKMFRHYRKLYVVLFVSTCPFLHYEFRSRGQHARRRGAVLSLIRRTIWDALFKVLQIGMIKYDFRILWFKGVSYVLV